MRHTLYFLLWALLFASVSSCKKSNDPGPLPEVHTVSVAGVDYSSVTVSVQVTREGSSVLGGTGVVIGTKANPTLLDRVVPNTQVGVGSYTIQAGQLAEGTQYHVRAYATNLQGTAYGEDLVFTTLNRGAPSIRIDSIVPFNYLKFRIYGSVISDGGASIQSVFGKATYDTSQIEGVDLYATSISNGKIYAEVRVDRPLTRTYVLLYASNSLGTGSATSSAISGSAGKPQVYTLNDRTITYLDNYRVNFSRYEYGVIIPFQVYDNGTPISRAGICYGFDPNLTLATAAKVYDAYTEGYTYYGAFAYDLVNTPKTYYARVFVQYGDSVVYGRQVTHTAPAFPNPTVGRNNIQVIGEIPIMFHDKDGRVTSSVKYGAAGVNYSGAQSLTNGRVNTQNLISVRPVGMVTAASVCSDLVAFGYDDWYLPAKNQLTDITVYGTPSFTNGSSGFTYWCSTASSTADEAVEGYVYPLSSQRTTVSFSTGSVTQSHEVMCVR